MIIPAYIGDVVSILAFALSIYAVWATYKFRKNQIPLIEMQKQLNEYQIEKNKLSDTELKKAEMGASIVKIGNGNYRLKVFNAGPSSARNVEISFPEGNDLVIDSDVREKFPMEVLEKFQHVDLIAAVSLGTKRKHMVQLHWIDDISNNNEKTVYLTL